MQRVLSIMLFLLCPIAAVAEEHVAVPVRTSRGLLLVVLPLASAFLIFTLVIAALIIVCRKK